MSIPLTQPWLYKALSIALNKPLEPFPGFPGLLEGVMRPSGPSLQICKDLKGLKRTLRVHPELSE